MQKRVSAPTRSTMFWCHDCRVIRRSLRERPSGPTCVPFGCGVRPANVLGVLFRSAFRNTRGVSFLSWYRFARRFFGIAAQPLGWTLFLVLATLPWFLRVVSSYVRGSLIHRIAAAVTERAIRNSSQGKKFPPWEASNCSGFTLRVSTQTRKFSCFSLIERVFFVSD